MAENSNIEWTHHTFNPWEGCQNVGPGCDHCYAEARDQRFTGGTHWGPGAPRRRTSPQNWSQPLKWDRAAQRDGTRARVFCASLADVFDNAVDPAWRDDLWRLIAMTPHLDWMLLTKRPGNIAKMLPPSWGNGWHNVWLGCTVVNQEEADRDIPKLLEVPAAVRFLSIEPLLGPIDVTLDGAVCLPCPNVGDGLSMDPDTGAYECCSRCDYTGIGDEWGIDLVIVGGESGPGARPMHPDWPRQIRDQCVAAGVAFFFKQWGEWAPVMHDHDYGGHVLRQMEPCGSFDSWKANAYDPTRLEGVNWRRIGKKAAGRHLDGRTWDQMPEVRNG